MANAITTSPVWSYHSPVNIVSGSIESLNEHAPPGHRVLLVTTAGFVRRGIVERLRHALPNCDIAVLGDVAPNPDLLYLDDATIRFRKKEINLVVAVGGGSALDAGKILSLTIPSREANLLKRLFRENTAFAWTTRLPLVTVPTTAGTGAEVTPFATVWDHEYKRKHSVSSPLLFPDLALLDVSLTLTLPTEEMLYPGLDTVSHALESLWNKNRTPVSRALAMHALSLATDALPGVLRQPESLEHRTHMQHASLLAGMAISQTRTAIAHAISYPLTAHHGVPHGLACSFTLPTLLRANMGRVPKNDYERCLLHDLLRMLDTLNLDQRLRSYLKREQLDHLLDEMFSAERSNNYDGIDLGSTRSIIDSALPNVDIE